MKNKKLISIISVVVALLLIVSSVTVGLFLWETDGKDSEKRVVQVNKPSGNNDPYGNDDITLDMGYTVEDMQNIDDLFGTEELCTLKVFNGSDPLCTNFRGLTSSVYHATEFLDMDPNGRKYTEEMIDLEFKRYKKRASIICVVSLNPIGCIQATTATPGIGKMKICSLSTNTAKRLPNMISKYL